MKPVAVFATMAFLCVGIYVLWDNLGPQSPTPYSIEILMQGRTQTGLRGGQPIYDEFQVQPGGVMKSKDYFRFRTQIDKDAHVYIIFQDSTGQIQAMEKGFIFRRKSVPCSGRRQMVSIGSNYGHRKDLPDRF